MIAGTTNGLALVLVKVAFCNPEALRLAAQLYGVAPCPKCDYIKTHCRCPEQAKMKTQLVPLEVRLHVAALAGFASTLTNCNKQNVDGCECFIVPKHWAEGLLRNMHDLEAVVVKCTPQEP